MKMWSSVPGGAEANGNIHNEARRLNGDQADVVLN
jgi:hypothetical protein